ncbi:c-type cytochrome [Aquimarina pacifica]|uniref:c-type cytochrome n=1 Tax=Aquimarina pacifica TaxID=1296415 RepID=UPI000471CC17|nr:cytochrome c [Aquimarina pacifica]
MRTPSRKIVLPVALLLIVTITVLAQHKKSKQRYTICTIKKPQETTLSKSISRGAELYTDFCMQCHMTNGKGTPKVFPPLAGSDWLTNKKEETIHAIKFGIKGPIKVNGETYNNTMTPLGLEDEEIADIMNYIMNSWGNTQKKMVTTEEVAAIKKTNK